MCQCQSQRRTMSVVDIAVSFANAPVIAVAWSIGEVIEGTEAAARGLVLKTVENPLAEAL